MRQSSTLELLSSHKYKVVSVLQSSLASNATQSGMSPHLQVKYYHIYTYMIIFASCVKYIHIYLYIFKYMYIASTLCAKVAKIKSRDKLYVHVQFMLGLPGLEKPSSMPLTSVPLYHCIYAIQYESIVQTRKYLTFHAGSYKSAFSKCNFTVEDVSGPYESRHSPWNATCIIHIVRYQFHLVLHSRMTYQLLQLIPVVPPFSGADEIIAVR